MLLARLPIGSDMPVPTSLPGRAPVAGFAPGGTPCGVTGCARTGMAIRPANNVDSARERMVVLLPILAIGGRIGGRRAANVARRRSGDDKPVRSSPATVEPQPLPGVLAHPA